MAAILIRKKVRKEELWHAMNGLLEVSERVWKDQGMREDKLAVEFNDKGEAVRVLIGGKEVVPAAVTNEDRKVSK